MTMAVKSSLMIGIQTMQPECWSSMESLNTESSWEWNNNEDPSSTTRWASVTVASSAGGSQSDEFSPVYVSAPSVESVKNEPAGRDDESSPEKGNGMKLGRSLEKQAGGSSSLGSSPPGKKQRGPLSPCVTTLVPRCQVEGCKADLSGCKDYHKRHKVCEMHAKAPKAIAGGIEQRFCQQCSRFHLLKEFDEGKRSCRRRLAGHNERRRKPHPEPHSFFGLSNAFLHREISTSTLSGAPFYFPEDVKPSSVLHPHRGSLLEFNGLHSYDHSLTRASPWPLKATNDSIPTFQIQNPKTPMTTLKPTPGLNLSGHPHHFLEGSSLGPLGQGLSLSSSTVGGVLGSLEQQSPMESLSSAMDSGRALSLLSSQSWAPCGPPASSAQAAQPGDSTLEHLVASSNESSTRFSHPSCSSTTRAQPFSIQSGGLDSGGLTFGLTATGTGTHEQRGGCNMLAGLGGGYHETNSMLALVHGGHALNNNAGFGSSHQGQATMDLMQTVHSNGVYNSNSNNSSFSSVRAFESSRFNYQQLL